MVRGISVTWGSGGGPLEGLNPVSDDCVSPPFPCSALPLSSTPRGPALVVTQAVALRQWPTVILAPACIKLTLVVGSVKGISGGQVLGSHSLFTISGKSCAIYSDVIPAPRSRPAYDP